MLAALLNLGFAGSGTADSPVTAQQGRNHKWVVAYLYDPGVAAPKHRPSYASRGANTAIRGAVALDVVVASEGDAVDRTRVPVNLTRFGVGDAIPAHYKVVSETEGEFVP